jgi:protein phosphatase
VRPIVAIDVGVAADKGRVRRQNEDRHAVLLPPSLAAGIDLAVVVADGMGGSQAGEVASTMVVDRVAREVSRGGAIEANNGSASFDDLLKRIIQDAHRDVRDVAAGDRRRRGMGSTVTAAIVANDRLHLGHVGDSRAYLACGDKILQLSTDHCWVADQIRAGQLTTDEALGHPKRHYITRFVGSAADLQVDTVNVTISEGDHLLVCTDGLTNLVTDDELLDCLKTSRHPAIAAERLLALASARGGEDDVTVVVARLVSLVADNPSPEPPEDDHETRPLRLGRLQRVAFSAMALLALLSLWTAATDQSLWSIAENLVSALLNRGMP